MQIKTTSSHISVAPTTQHIDMLIEVGDSAALPSKRPSLNIAVVIDVSSSMSGAPLEHAKSAALNFLEHLEEGDRLAVIAYSDQAHVVNPSVATTPENKRTLQGKIAGLMAQGNTALHSGWLHGADAVAPFVSDYGITRVFLLSDGQANRGVTDATHISQQAQQLNSVGISTSTYGVGTYFNETLMTQMACGGNAFYAQSSHNLIECFTSELQLLKNTMHKNVRVKPHATCAGKELQTQVLNDYHCADGVSSLPNVLHGGQSWMVLRVLGPFPSPVDLVIETTSHSFVGPSIPHKMSLSIANSSEASNVDSSVLKERLKELEAVRLQKQAVAEAHKGNWDRVSHLVGSISQMAEGNVYVASVGQTLSALSASRNANLLNKESAYAARAMSSRTVSNNEDVSVLNDQYGLKKSQQGKH